MHDSYATKWPFLIISRSKNSNISFSFWFTPPKYAFNIVLSRPFWFSSYWRFCISLVVTFSMRKKIIIQHYRKKLELKYHICTQVTFIFMIFSWVLQKYFTTRHFSHLMKQFSFAARQFFNLLLQYPCWVGVIVHIWTEFGTTVSRYEVGHNGWKLIECAHFFVELFWY